MFTKVSNKTKKMITYAGARFAPGEARQVHEDWAADHKDTLAAAGLSVGGAAPKPKAKPAPPPPAPEPEPVDLEPELEEPEEEDDEEDEGLDFDELMRLTKVGLQEMADELDLKYDDKDPKRVLATAILEALD